MKSIQKRRGHLCGLALLICGAHWGGLARAALAAVPEGDQQMFDQGRYQPLLAELNQALAQKKTAAADRYSLLILKGETLLRTRGSAGAQDAFTAAALVGPDEASIATAKATAMLIKHSSAGKYQPKIKASGSKDLPPAIDIVDPASRKNAFVALLADLLVTLQPQVSSAENSTSLSPMIPLAKQLGDARNIENAGTGSDTQSKDLLTKLATRAGSLMNGIIKPMDDQITAVTKDATAHQKKMGKRTSPDSFADLSPNDSSALSNITNSAGQVSTAAGQMAPVFGDIGDFKTIQSDADKLVAEANKLLKQYHH